MVGAHEIGDNNEIEGKGEEREGRYAYAYVKTGSEFRWTDERKTVGKEKERVIQNAPESLRLYHRRDSISSRIYLRISSSKITALVSPRFFNCDTRLTRVLRSNADSPFEPRFPINRLSINLNDVNCNY